MMPLIMEGGIPAQMVGRDIHRGRYLIALGSKQVAPALRVIVTELRSILPPE